MLMSPEPIQPALAPIYRPVHLPNGNGEVPLEVATLRSAVLAAVIDTINAKHVKMDLFMGSASFTVPIS
jgi:hypothetical protein